MNDDTTERQKILKQFAEMIKTQVEAARSDVRTGVIDHPKADVLTGELHTMLVRLRDSHDLTMVFYDPRTVKHLSEEQLSGAEIDVFKQQGRWYAKHIYPLPTTNPLTETRIREIIREEIEVAFKRFADGMKGGAE